MSFDRFKFVSGLFLAIAVFCNTAGCEREAPSEPVPGVRLGMAPRDVRDRFEGGGAGAWQTKIGGGAGASDDTVLEWTENAGGASRTTQARFEFHLGMLVAIRAHLREPIASERIDLTPKTVTLRKPATAGSDVTILARDCPTHKDEAEALSARAKLSR